MRRCQKIIFDRTFATFLMLAGITLQGSKTFRLFDRDKREKSNGPHLIFILLKLLQIVAETE
jgi:hypothetical protein